MWCVHPISPEEAQAVCTWNYPPPYDRYTVSESQTFLRSENRYHAVLRGTELVGFFCLGLEAQVPGGKYEQPGIDLGLGMHPDLTGQGLGKVFLNVILNAVQASPLPLRLTVAAFNHRARRLYENTGFRAEYTFVDRSGLEYIQMTRSAPNEPDTYQLGP